MKVAVFSTKSYDRRFLDLANVQGRHRLNYFDVRLSGETAALAHDAEAVCAFVNDEIDRAVLKELAGRGVRLVALRSAGFNHVDLHAARELGVTVARVPDAFTAADVAVALEMAIDRGRDEVARAAYAAEHSMESYVGRLLSTLGIESPAASVRPRAWRESA